MVWFIPGLLGLIAAGLIGGGLWLMQTKRLKKQEASAPRPVPEINPLPLPDLASDRLLLKGPYPVRPSAISFPVSEFTAGTFLAAGSLLIIFALIFGCAMTTNVTLPAWQRYYLFKNTGITTEAVVIDRPFTQASQTRSPYQITYQYTALLPNGESQQFTTTTPVHPRTYDSLPLGKIFPILYLPTNPAASYLQSEFAPPFDSLALGGVGLLLTLGGFVIIILGRLELKQVMALDNRGQIIGGIIFERWAPFSGRPPCVAYYFDLPGQPKEHSRVVRAEFNERAYYTYQVGDQVQIRYLPENPKLCRLEL